MSTRLFSLALSGCLVILAGSVGLGVYRLGFWPKPPEQEKDKSSEPVLVQEDLLPESERQYLWEIEHHGQLLSQIGFKEKLAKAIESGDTQALREILADKFEGSALANPRKVS